MEFRLEYGEFRRLHRRALRAQRRDHSEVVGLLAASRDDPAALALRFLQNWSTQPGSYLLSSDEVKECRRALKAEGKLVLGMFHSHPLSQAVLGRKEVRTTPSGWLHLVYDVCGLEPRLYRVSRRLGQRVVIIG